MRICKDKESDKKRQGVYGDILFCGELMNRLIDDTENIDFPKTVVQADIRRLRRELLKVHKKIEEIAW